MIYVLMVAALLVVLFLSVDGLPRSKDEVKREAYWDNVNFSLPDTVKVAKSYVWPGSGIWVETQDANASRTDVILNGHQLNRPAKKNVGDKGIAK